LGQFGAGERLVGQTAIHDAGEGEEETRGIIAAALIKTERLLIARSK
jgi:hypothetical protein